MNELSFNNSLNKSLERLYKGSVGFDSLLRMFDDANTYYDSHSYPPYNIEKLGEDEYAITVALAGFSAEDVDITLQDGVLTISGVQSEETGNGKTYLYKGIATRHFKRQFQLADYIEVNNAEFHNGLLRIELVRRVPEEKKAKQIPIKNGHYLSVESRDE